MISNRKHGFETFDHTADIGIRAWGSDLAQVFEEIAKALFSVVVELNTVSARQKMEVTLRADSDGDLLLAWLKELLFIFETRRLLCKEFKVRLINKKITPSPLSSPPGRGRGQGEGVSLEADIFCEKLDNTKHRLGREVKAITLHQFKLIREKSRYLAEVILDI